MTMIEVVVQGSYGSFEPTKEFKDFLNSIGYESVFQDAAQLIKG